MRRAIAAVCVACLWTAHGAGMSAPFGARLGEKLLDAQSPLTPDILELYILTNGVRGLPFDNIAWHGAERFEDVGLSRPLMGVSSARVGVDQNGIAYEFNVCGSFRRGLTRKESLQKIEALRKNVERECGFILNDYSFCNPKTNGNAGRSFQGRLIRSGSGSNNIVQPWSVRRELTADTVGGEGRGPELWEDLDCVAADSVTTHDGVRVAISCDVNTGEESGATDSPVKVMVKFVLVDMLRMFEDRRNAEMQLLSNRKKTADTARINELFGVEFGERAQSPTNELTKSGCTSCLLDGDGKPKCERKFHFWERTITCADVPFVNELCAKYSLRSMRPCEISGHSRIPKIVDRQEALRRFDEFVLGLNKRYGIAMRRNADRIVARRAFCGGLDGASEPDLVRYEFRNDFLYILLELDLQPNVRAVSFIVCDRTASDLIDSEGRETKER